MVNQHRAVNPVQEIVDGISGARQTQRAVNNLVQRGRVVKVNATLAEADPASMERPEAQSITADVEVRSASGRAVVVRGFLCTVPVRRGMLVNIELPHGSTGLPGIIVGRALPPAAQRLFFQKNVALEGITTAIASWVRHATAARPAPPTVTLPSALASTAMGAYTSRVNALRGRYPDTNFNQVFGAFDGDLEPPELVPLINPRHLHNFVVASETMRFQTTIDVGAVRCLYGLFQNQSGYAAEVAGDTSRTTVIIGEEIDRQPTSLLATFRLQTDIIDAETEAVVDSHVSVFDMPLERSYTDRVPVQSQTVSGETIRTGSYSTHVERISELVARNNRYEYEISFERLGAYMGQTMNVKHYASLSFGTNAIDTATGYLGSIPSDSIAQVGIWGISMRETGDGSELTPPERRYVEENPEVPA